MIKKRGIISLSDQELIRKLVKEKIFKNYTEIASVVFLDPSQINRVANGKQALRPEVRAFLQKVDVEHEKKDKNN